MHESSQMKMINISLEFQASHCGLYPSPPNATASDTQQRHRSATASLYRTSHLKQHFLQVTHTVGDLVFLDVVPVVPSYLNNFCKYVTLFEKKKVITKVEGKMKKPLLCSTHQTFGGGFYFTPAYLCF